MFHVVANATAVGQDQVPLERFRVFGGDLDACQFAKAGVDAIHGLRAQRGLPYPASSLVDGGSRGAVHRDGKLFAIDPLKIRKCDGPRGQDKRAHASPPKIRSCRGLKPMR